MTLDGARTYRIYGDHLWFLFLPAGIAIGAFLVHKTATSEQSPGWLFTGFWMTALVWIAVNVVFHELLTRLRELGPRVEVRRL